VDERQKQEEGISSETSDTVQPEVLGSKNTFVIQVRCQQNASWQGSVHWVESEQTQHFRSALELIRLMDKALGKP
jgi:hypothetical protein